MFCLEQTDSRKIDKAYLDHCLYCSCIYHPACLRSSYGSMQAKCCDETQAGKERNCELCGQGRAIQSRDGERTLHAVCRFALSFCKNQTDRDTRTPCTFCNNEEGLLLKCSSEHNDLCGVIFHQKCHEDALLSLPITLERYYYGQISLKCFPHSDDRKKKLIESLLLLKKQNFAEKLNASALYIPTNLSFLGANTKEKWNNSMNSTLHLNFQEECKGQYQPRGQSRSYLAYSYRSEAAIDETAKVILKDMVSAEKPVKIDLSEEHEKMMPVHLGEAISTKSVKPKRCISKKSFIKSEGFSTSKVSNFSPQKITEIEVEPQFQQESIDSNLVTLHFRNQGLSEFTKLEELPIITELECELPEINNIRTAIVQNFAQYRNFASTAPNFPLFEVLSIELNDQSLINRLSEGHQKAWDLINSRIGRRPSKPVF